MSDASLPSDVMPDVVEDVGAMPVPDAGEVEIGRCLPSDVVEPELAPSALRSASVDASTWQALPERAECCDITRTGIGDPEGEVARSQLASRGDGTHYVAWEIGAPEDWTRELVVARIDDEGRLIAGPRALGRWWLTGLAAHGSRAVLTANRPTSTGGLFEGHVFALDDRLSVCESFERAPNVLYHDVARHVAAHSWVVVMGRRRSRTTADLSLVMLDDSLRVVREVPLANEAPTLRVTLLTTGAFLVTDVEGERSTTQYVHVDAELRFLGELIHSHGSIATFRDGLLIYDEDAWFSIELPTLAMRRLAAPPGPIPSWGGVRHLASDDVLGTVFGSHHVFAGDGRWLATSARRPGAFGNDVTIAPGVMLTFGAAESFAGPRGVRVEVARLRAVE